jgi:hypothetical protein
MYFFFSTASRPGLGTTQPIQWLPRALSPGTERSGREADDSPPSNAEVRIGGFIPPLLLDFIASFLINHGDFVFFKKTLRHDAQEYVQLRFFFTSPLDRGDQRALSPERFTSFNNVFKNNFTSPRVRFSLSSKTVFLNP